MCRHYDPESSPPRLAVHLSAFRSGIVVVGATRGSYGRRAHVHGSVDPLRSLGMTAGSRYRSSSSSRRFANRIGMIVASTHSSAAAPKPNAISDVDVGVP